MANDSPASLATVLPERFYATPQDTKRQYCRAACDQAEGQQFSLPMAQMRERLLPAEAAARSAWCRVSA